MSGDKKTDNLIDVTPISFGTDIVGGFMSIIIPRGTVIPAKMTKTYFTVNDYQT